MLHVKGASVQDTGLVLQRTLDSDSPLCFRQENRRGWRVGQYWDQNEAKSRSNSPKDQEHKLPLRQGCAGNVADAVSDQGSDKSSYCVPEVPPGLADLVIRHVQNRYGQSECTVWVALPFCRKCP